MNLTNDQAEQMCARVETPLRAEIERLQKQLAEAQDELRVNRQIWSHSSVCKAAVKEARTANQEASNFAEWFGQEREKVFALEQRIAELSRPSPAYILAALRLFVKSGSANGEESMRRKCLRFVDSLAETEHPAK